MAFVTFDFFAPLVPGSRGGEALRFVAVPFLGGILRVTDGMKWRVNRVDGLELMAGSLLVARVSSFVRRLRIWGDIDCVQNFHIHHLLK